MRSQLQKNDRAARQRYYAMLNWGVHCQKAEEHFRGFASEARQRGFFESLYVSRDDSARQVQLFAGQHPIGSIAIRRDSIGREVGRTLQSEHGAALVISQATNGSVAVILYPYESSSARRTQPYIIWALLNEPTEITDQLLRKCTNDFLTYVRVSSSLFVESRYDRLRISYLELRGRQYLGNGRPYKLLFSGWFLPTLGAVGSCASIWSVIK
jgi:hypothetical protein